MSRGPAGLVLSSSLSLVGMACDELNAAEKQLENAVDRYLNACSAVGTTETLEPSWNLLTQELGTISSASRKLYEAWTIIGRMRNRCPSSATISAFPAEVLARIFLFVPAPYRRLPPARKSERSDLFQPERLMFVCSRWYHIVKSLQPLWAHIDLACDDNPLSGRLISRAYVSAARAGNLPLDVQLIAPVGSSGSPIRYFSDNIQFLTHHATRIGSLEIIADEAPDFYCWMILGSFFEACTPGIFTELILSGGSVLRGARQLHSFLPFESNGLQQGLSVPGLQVPQPQLDEVLLGITSLHLYDIYPHWTSKTYHGLVELSITSHITWIAPMTEPQFLNILTSCPQLQALYLAFPYLTLLSGSLPVAPARLYHLRRLGIQSAGFGWITRVLQLIAPGSAPLELSIGLHPRFAPQAPTSTYLNNFREFFTRSTVTSLCMVGSIAIPWVPQLLPLLPNRLQNLALYQFDSRLGLSSLPEESEVAPSYYHFVDVYSSVVDLDAFQELTDGILISKLRFSNCTFTWDGQTIDQTAAIPQLSAMCSNLSIRNWA